MQQLLQILVAGGDRRQQYAAQKLAESPQLSVTTIGFSPSDSETLPEFDVLILPIHTTAESVPSQNGNLSLPELLSHVKKGGLVCGGVLPEAVCRMCQEQELCFCDYFQREELCLANAVPTVEGAIQIAISERETVLCGSSVLVIGYGRIGTIMAERLQGLKADVTVAARSCKDAERCAANGLKWMHPSEIAAHAGEFDWFCNTVPVLMLDETALSNMKPDVLVIDLASKPGGTDFDAAKRLHRHVVWALGLPGITAPKTAGAIIAKTIFHILQERGLADEGNNW